MAILSLEGIVELLMRDDETGRKAVGRALLALNERQTNDEQIEGETKYDNKMGFQKCHARRGTSMANYFRIHGKITDKQWKWWTSTAPGGKRPRILIYAGQLLRIAQIKQRGEQHNLGI